MNETASGDISIGPLPYIHKLGKPPKQNLLKEIITAAKETFFSDDPLRSFKDKPKSKKFVLGVQAVFPIIGWARNYSLSKFKGDLIAGLTIASLCIPQDIGYAKLAYLPPQNGLYSSFVPPLVYAFMGSSRDIAIGPVAVVSLLLGDLLQAEIDPNDLIPYRRLAFTATFFAGLTQLALVELADYSNWGDILGFSSGRQTHCKDNPYSSLTFQSYEIFNLVNHIEKGINPVSANDLFLSGEYVGKAFRIGVVAGIIALTEAIAIGRTFATMKDYQIDGNKEMVALGTMNIIGSLTSCYVATGSFSRSAVNYMSGCHTAVSNIVMAGVVFLTLELITPLFKYTPNAILASIIIAAVVNLLDYEAAILIWKIDKFDFVACMGAFFGVVFMSVEIGLLIAVSLSLAKILLQVTRPRTAVLGKLPRTSVYRNTLQYPEARKIPGVLIVRVDSAIYFSNSNYIKERILRWLAEEEELVNENNLPRIQHLIVEMSPVTDIDTSGIHALEELYKNLQKKEVQLALANPGTIVMEKLYASEFANEIGENNIFLSVGDAVHVFAPKTSNTEEP
ncbi:hypothetical protein CsatB_026497 [Cannabis sativa]